MKVGEEVKVEEEVTVNEELETSEEIVANGEVEASGETKVKKEFKVDKELLTKLAFFIGLGGMFLVGILFSVMCDLTLKAASYWLIGGILFTFGGGACAVLSETFREKPIVKWIMKGLAVALAVGFIGFAVGMQVNLLELNQTTPKVRDAVVPVMVTLIVLDAIALIALVGDVTLNALQKEE